MTKLSEHRSRLQKVASALLIVLMVLGTVGMVSVLFGDLKRAEATSGGNYYVKVYWNVNDASDKSDNYWKLTYKDQDGSDHEYTYGSNAASGTGDYNSGILTLSGVPYKIFYQLHNSGGWFFGSAGWYIKKIEISKNSDMSGAVTLWEGSVGCKCSNTTSQTINVTYNIVTDTNSGWSNGNGNSKETKTTNKQSPYLSQANSIDDIGGGSASVSVPIDGTSTNETNAFSTNVKDQYGVVWYQDATLGVSSHAGVSFSDNKVKVNSDANASNNYTVTVTASFSGLTSKTKTVTVNVFDYKVTFYDENGTTVLKSEQTVDYGGSATAPADPTKTSPVNDEICYYDFAGWTGDGYTNITTGAQTKAVKASYTARGHNWVTTPSADHLKSAATCDSPAVYHKYCFKCGRNHPTDTFTSGNALGHAWGTPSYVWAADNSSVTATVVCGNDSSHQITETVETVASTTPATCEAAGSTVYTATFQNPLFETQTNTVVIEKLGHDWGAWTSISEEQHQRTCGNDASHTETENHNYGAWVDQNDGTKIRTCPDCGHSQTMHVSYSVQFNGNGATGGSMNPQSFTCGTPQNLTANAFTRSYTVTYVYNNGDADGSATAAAAFDGWATAADGAKVYDDGQSVNNLTTVENGVVNLYAVWTLGSVTLPTPVNTGYVFAGWYADSTLETAVSGSSFTPTANTTLYAKWTQIAVDDQFILQNGLPATLDVLGNDISGAAIDSVSGGTGFTTDISNGKILFTPSAALTGTVSFTYTASYGGQTATATVKVVPATNVYYEESGFINFTDGTASWQDAGTEYSNVFQEGQRPGESGSPMAAYETTNETTYSLGNAKYVTVTKGDSGAAASFTFSGTGFDLYAATTNKAGAALVRVVSADGSYNKLTMVNAYFGYEYGQLYLKDGKVTLDSSGKEIYYTSDTGNDTFFVNGTRRGTTTPTSEGYAYGWVASSASSEDGIYQVPVISFMDLDYGTYTVTVTPQYSARQDLTGDGEYKFYVDAVRIYNPINPQALDSDAQAAYAQAKELGATYKEVRDLLINAETFDATGSNEAAGVAFLELSDTTKTALQNYEDIGPKNEVYLAPGQAIAFNMTTATNVAPAKLEIGLKMARGSSGSVRIDSAETQTVSITGATDLYRDITGTVQWTQTDASAYTTTGPIIITNTSDAGCVISITKVKWSYDQAVPASGRAMQFSFAAQDLVTAKAVAKAIHVAQTTADASGVVLKWNRASYSIGDAATLTITAPASFRQAYIDGAALTGYTETEEGLRQWTYTFVAQKSGTFSYDVTLEDGAARRTEPLTASVTVAGGQNAPGGNNGKRMLTLQQLLQTLAAKLMQIFKLSFMKGTVK